MTRVGHAACAQLDDGAGQGIDDLHGYRGIKEVGRADREITVGLNDRLAFTKHLFNDNAEAFKQTLSTLNTLDSQEGSLRFIRHEVKPKFDDWKGKDDYESRFMALIERRFN